MSDIVERLRFDAARCEATFSKGIATNIDEAATEIERLRDENNMLREYLQYIVDFEQDIYVSDAQTVSYMRASAIAALANQQLVANTEAKSDT